MVTFIILEPEHEVKVRNALWRRRKALSEGFDLILHLSLNISIGVLYGTFKANCSTGRDLCSPIAPSIVKIARFSVWTNQKLPIFQVNVNVWEFLSFNAGHRKESSKW